MIRFRRRNTSWLIALGALVTFALYTAPSSPLIQATLIGLLIAALFGSFVDLSVSQNDLLRSLYRTPIRRRVTPEAKEATERARNLSAMPRSDLTMLDVGLIALQTVDDGLTMRRTRSISKDDDGVRPFVILHVPHSEAERSARVRYEIHDHHGDIKYVYEAKPFLRDGEMNILADHHLPLADNDAIHEGGDWDMRVYVDGELFAMHTFTLAPSAIQRRERLVNKRATPLNEAIARIETPTEEEMPVTLEQLLKQEQQITASDSRIRRNIRTASRPRKE